MGRRWVFLINVPIVLHAAAMVRPALPRHTGAAGRSLDLLVTAELTLVIDAIVESGSGGGLATWPPGVAGILLLLGFLGHEHRTRRHYPPLRAGLAFTPITVSAGVAVLTTISVVTGSYAVAFGVMLGCAAVAALLALVFLPAKPSRFVSYARMRGTIREQ